MKDVICTIERVVYDEMDKRKKAITNTQWLGDMDRKNGKMNRRKKERKKKGRKEIGHLSYYLQIKKKQS